MWKAVLAAVVAMGAGPVGAQDGVLIRCGASSGHAYFFHDDVTNPDGPMWEEDRISSGEIVLVKLGEEWDIQFDDSIGAYGYRSDGARVVPLSMSDRYLMIGAFGKLYADIYTFDFLRREVAWTSSKLGPIVAKAAVFHADCY